jgi:serralysin
MNELFPIYETLAKVISYIDDRPELTAQVQLFLSQINYRIDRTFDNPATGFHAIGLLPNQIGNPPLLVFRGTDGLSDDPTLVDPRGIGRSQIEANQAELSSWLTEVGQSTQILANLIGHSLGGALAQNAAATFTSQFANLVTFNSPGVAKAIADQYLNNLNAILSANPGVVKNVTHFVVNGDLVSLVGESFLAGKTILQSYSDRSLNPLVVVPGDPIVGADKHTRRDLLTNPPSGYSQADLNTAELSSANFSFSNDLDFSIFRAAIARVFPQFSALLASRGNLEFVRSSNNASFFGLVAQLNDLLNQEKANFLQGDDRDNSAIALGGDDTILGLGGNDRLFSNLGNDSINGGDGNDQLFGGQGNDTLLGLNGDDLLFGNLGDDLLNGGDGNDQLFGGQGLDNLVGFNGNDSLSGDLGNDILTGGAGNDRFILATGRGTDTITDFAIGQDLLQLPTGISFNQLRIEIASTSSNSATLIILASNNEAIASLSGTINLGQNDFVVA